MCSVANTKLISMFISDCPGISTPFVGGSVKPCSVWYHRRCIFLQMLYFLHSSSGFANFIVHFYNTLMDWWRKLKMLLTMMVRTLKLRSVTPSIFTLQLNGSYVIVRSKRRRSMETWSECCTVSTKGRQFRAMPKNFKQIPKKIPFNDFITTLNLKAKKRSAVRNLMKWRSFVIDLRKWSRAFQMTSSPIPLRMCALFSTESIKQSTKKHKVKFKAKVSIENVLLQIFQENGSCIQCDSSHSIGICCSAYDLQRVPNGHGKLLVHIETKSNQLVVRVFPNLFHSFIDC